MLAAAFLLLAQGVTPPLPVTEAELRANPDRYAGKRVRLTGQIDSCHGWNCALCPETATPDDQQRDHCLSLSFGTPRDAAGISGARFEPLYRYATVTLNARFDPACWANPCTDRGPVLLDAHVERVLRRRSSGEGLIARPEPLVAAPSVVADAVIADLRRREFASEGLQFRAFMVQGAADADSAIACHRPSRGSSAENAWPATLQAALLARSTQDTFRCWNAERIDGVWTTMID